MKQIIVILLGCILILNAQTSRVSVAGYTTWDWFFTGPTLKWCITDTAANGIHIAWTWCDGVSANSNARYNFYNFTNRNWNWPGGINVFTQRSGFSSMDNHSNTGRIYIMSSQLARDQAPGAGLFEYFSRPPNASSPVIAVTPDTIVHCVFLDAIAGTLSYSRMTTNGNWSTPIPICPPAPEPMFPTYNIAVSKMSNKVIVLWECAEDPQQRAFYRISNNSGITWEQPVQIPFPPGVDEFNITSFYAMFDYNDNFHFVCAVCDTDNVYHCRIWHYCPVNNPAWSIVSSYHPDTLTAPVGYNAIGADRPTIVENLHDHYFYVAWEQFDSLNYEPSTSLSRADIWIAESPNNGQNWQNQRPITTPNTTSKRFPCAGGVDHDTLTVTYMIDSIAGFELYGQGRATFNPIVIQRIKVPLPTSEIKENHTSFTPRLLLNVKPNPFASYATIHFSLPAESKISLVIYNVSGRLVKTLVNELKNSGVYNMTWNGTNDKGDEVKSGIYFCTLKTSDKLTTQKIVKTN
jgi:hypothetical protein